MTPQILKSLMNKGIISNSDSYIEIKNVTNTISFFLIKKEKEIGAYF